MSVDRDVLAENLYGAYTQAVSQASLQLPEYRHLTGLQRQRWQGVAEYVLGRERQLVYKGVLKRAHKRIAARILERLDR